MYQRFKVPPAFASYRLSTLWTELVAALRVQIRALESFLATILPTEKEPLLGPNTQATYRQEIEAALRKIGQ